MAAWLRELSGLSVAATNEAELQAQLKNGVVLCYAANRMGANIPAVSTSDKMFEQISNICKFLDFVKSTGVADRDLFVTTDLYDNKRHEAGDDWIELSRSSASQGAWIRWSNRVPTCCRQTTLYFQHCHHDGL
jgi:hypothetical protein